ncbi:MAG: PD-(D/E)XK nuclease family protein [Planctomycetes bacterium]|jgi:hypothetical protein|nr:PD-(D/E)XK nuclease family protein [Planctomycetota bacterium]
MSTYEEVAGRLAEWKHRFPAFVQALDREGVRYTSFSKVTSVEFCEARYLLESVLHEELTPRPAYFVKGEVFHDAAARIWRGVAAGRPASLSRLLSSVARKLDDDPPHLRNAVRLAFENVLPDHEVVAVERPFVLDLGPDLPPALGIVDLLLRNGHRYVLVDHKTGKTFGEHDDLQLVLYREWVRREHGAADCTLLYDEYRWVNNLDTIRKPAFRRTEVRPPPGSWRAALARLGAADETMRRIERTREPEETGECFRCPWRPQCPHQGW